MTIEIDEKYPASMPSDFDAMRQAMVSSQLRPNAVNDPRVCDRDGKGAA